MDPWSWLVRPLVGDQHRATRVRGPRNQKSRNSQKSQKVKKSQTPRKHQKQPEIPEMTNRLTYRRRLSYNTKSNSVRIVKTPGAKLVYQYTKKRGTNPKCGDCGCTIPGVPALRPREYARISKRQKSVTRAYGGSRCNNCVRDRCVIIFLLFLLGVLLLWWTTLVYRGTPWGALGRLYLGRLANFTWPTWPTLLGGLVRLDARTSTLGGLGRPYQMTASLTADTLALTRA